MAKANSQPAQLTEEQKEAAAQAAAAKKAKEEKEAAAQAAAAKKAKEEKEAAAQAAAKAAAEKLEASRKTELLKHTKDTYVPEPGTEKSYHARIEVKSFDKNSGDRQSKPQLQIFSDKAFSNFEKNSPNLGYSVDLLHDPTGKYPVCGVERAKAEAKKEAKNQK